MTDDHDMLDLEVLNRQHDDTVDAVVLLRVRVGYVAVNKDFAGCSVEEG